MFQQLVSVWVTSVLLTGNAGAFLAEQDSSQVDEEKRSVDILKANKGDITFDDKGRASKVDLSINRATAECVKALSAFSSLRMLNLNVNPKLIDDASLKSLDQLNDLETLLLYSSPSVTDMGVGHLRNLKKLKHLVIAHSQVSDKGLRMITDWFPELEILNLTSTHVTDRGVPGIIGLTKLSSLALENTSITDAALVDIWKLKNLRVLNLEKSSISDKALKAIVKCQNLEDLFLAGTKVTPNGLKELCTLRKLLRVSLDGGVLTEEGIAALVQVRSLRKLHIDGEADDTKRRKTQDKLQSVQIYFK